MFKLYSCKAEFKQYVQKTKRRLRRVTIPKLSNSIGDELNDEDREDKLAIEADKHLNTFVETAALSGDEQE